MIQRAGQKPAGQRRLVLVVEDEEPIRTFVRRVLEQEGYECLEAGSAEEALVVAGQGRRVDILVLDIMLPDSWGTRLVEDIRAHSPEAGVILVSGYAESDPILGAGIGERHPFLSKPFEAGDLLRAVRQVEGLSPA